VRLRCILFDLLGTLVDPARLNPCTALQIGQVMAGRFGGDPAGWTQAHSAVLADWDSYYADLDLSGDDGIANLWEGMLRTTRALFRLTQTPEPPLAEVIALSRELPYLTVRQCDTCYPEVKGVLERLTEAGLTLGVTSHTTSAHVRGLLEGGEIQHLINGPVLCTDSIRRYNRDKDFFRASGLPPESCLVVDDQPDALHGAAEAGMKTALLCRGKATAKTDAFPTLRGDLSDVMRVLSTEY
jgi:FMN phosphatase YigB (HAD superfamily)